MTNEEKYIAQGHARDLAKQLRSEVATLRTWCEEYSQTLVNMEHVIGHWLRDPHSKAADGRLLIDHLNDLQRELAKPGFFEKTSELMEANRKLKRIEDEIKEF
ncbi:MAG: hypothetical protein WCA13_05830 [Terriglobales bacterium]